MTNIRRALQAAAGVFDPMIFDNWEDLLLVPYNDAAAGPNRLAFYDHVAGDFVHDMSLTAATGSAPQQIFRHFSTGQLMFVFRSSRTVAMVDIRTGNLIWSTDASGYAPMTYAQDKIVSVGKSGTSVIVYTQAIDDDGLSALDSHSFMTTTDSTSIVAYSGTDGCVAHEISGSFEMAQTGDVYFSYSVPDEGAPQYKPRFGLGKISTGDIISSVSDSIINTNLSRPSASHGDGHGQQYCFDGNVEQSFSTSMAAYTSISDSANGYVRGCGSRNATYPIIKAFHHPYHNSMGGGVYKGAIFVYKYDTSGGETAIHDVDDSTNSQYRGPGVQTAPLGCFIFYNNAVGNRRYKFYTASTDTLGGETGFSGTAPWGGSAILNYSGGNTTTCQVY